MDTSRIEELLERLIDKQDDLIARIDNLETKISDTAYNLGVHLSDINFKAEQVYGELNWWGEEHSLAKQLLAALQSIDTSISSNS